MVEGSLGGWEPLRNPSAAMIASVVADFALSNVSLWTGECVTYGRVQSHD